MILILGEKRIIRFRVGLRCRAASRIGGAAESAQYKSCTAKRMLPPYQCTD